MAGFILRLLIVALGLWLASELVPGIEVNGVGTLLAAALLLGIVNAVVRPVLQPNQKADPPEFGHSASSALTRLKCQQQWR